MQNISSFLLGLILSFLGQLPLGTMSLTATQIAVQENFSNAWKYSLGVALIEIVYLRMVLSGMQWLMGHSFWLTLLNWMAIIFFLVLGVLSFIAARNQKDNNKALILNNGMNRFLMGMSMSALNPAQIPFWFIWSAYFINMGWLPTGFQSFNFFTAGSGLGTLGGLALYIYGGNWMVRKMKTSNRTLNTLMGIVFVIAAMAQIYHVIRN
jgi:threonine/homoserine/homoserine lactone efflux protein